MSTDTTIKRRMAQGLRATLVSRTIYIFANAGLMIALTRYLLTPDGYGQLTFVLAILGSTHLFLGLGVAKSGARYVTQYLETDEAQVPHVIITAATVIFGSIAVVGAIFWTFRVDLAVALGDPSLAPLLGVGVGYLATYPLAISVRMLFNAFNRISWSALLRAIDALVRLVFAVLFVLLGFGAVGAIFGYIAGFVAAAAVGAIAFYALLYSNLPKASSPESGLRRRVLRYAVPLTVTFGADALDTRVDAILVGVLLNPLAVGFYTLAKQIADFTIVPVQAIDTTLAPRMGERKASGNLESAARIYEIALKHVLLLYLPAGVGLALVAEPAIRYVFGTGYVGAVPVLRAFGAFVLVSSINRLTTNSLDYLGRGRERALVNGGTSVSNFGLNILLIPLFGVVGAAIATVITHSAYAIGNLYFISREIPIDVKRLLVEAGGVLAIAVGMGAVVWLARSHISGLVSLATVILLGMAVWVGLSLLSGLLELDLVREILS